LIVAAIVAMIKAVRALKIACMKGAGIRKGSITVFLTFIFAIMLSLVTAFIENVRVTTSGAYVATAANSALEVVFGSYNKELYDEYGLFAYGGYDGTGVSELEHEVMEVINQNLKYKPEKSLKTYSDLYRLNDISCVLEDFYTLDDDKVFPGQVSDYIITSVADNAKEFVSRKVSEETGGKTSGKADKKSIVRKGAFDEAIKYEDGKYNKDNNSDSVGDSSSSKDNGSNGKGNWEENSSQPSEEDIDKELENDPAGGNPLKALKNLINNGLLSLVCDVSKVSEGIIEAEEYNNTSKSSDDNSSAAKFFKSFIESDESQEPDQDRLIHEADSVSNSGKLKYMYYAEKVLSSYIDKEYNTVHYGLEYIIAGKETEKENLAYIVRRLLIIRTLVNMVYVSTNAALQSKSLATATKIAGFTGIAPLIAGIQWLVLMILAFEEACIDVTALLAGKKVPLIKNLANFKMKYEEICSVSHNFFKRKAMDYQKAEEGKISTDISYRQYLSLLGMLVSKEKIKNRIIDIIQFDLRERFNQTFEFYDCICAAECTVSYNIPYTGSYIKENILGTIKTRNADRRVTVSYTYIDGVWE